MSHTLYCTQDAVLHYRSIHLIAEPCWSAHLRAMEIAKEAGTLLSHDLNLREAFVIIPNTDICSISGPLP